MILDRRPPAGGPGPRSSKLAGEAAMNYRCFACPGPGVSEIRPGHAVGLMTRRRATVLSANPAGRAAQLLSIALARYPDRSGWRSASGIAYLALLATMPLTGVAGLAGLLPSTARCRGLVRQLFLENERATVMPTLKQRTLDGRAESRPAHPGPSGGPPPTPSTPQGSAQPSPRTARAPATVADITRPSPATIGEYDHVAAAAYLMKHAGSAALVVLGARHGSRPVGVITESDIARAVADGMDVNQTRIHDLLTARPAAIPAATSIRDAARTMVNGGFRQLPVTDGTGWIGIADIADICGALLAPSAA